MEVEKASDNGDEEMEGGFGNSWVVHFLILLSGLTENLSLFSV